MFAARGPRRVTRRRRRVQHAERVGPPSAVRVVSDTPSQAASGVAREVLQERPRVLGLSCHENRWNRFGCAVIWGD